MIENLKVPSKRRSSGLDGQGLTQLVQNATVANSALIDHTYTDQSSNVFGVRVRVIPRIFYPVELTPAALCGSPLPDKLTKAVDEW